MCLSDDWRHEQIQIIPQILPWAVRFHGIRTLHHYGTYTPLVPCSSTYLISNNPLEVPASSFWTASLFLKVIRAILAFFFPIKFPSIFAMDMYYHTLSLIMLISWKVLHLLEPSDKNWVSRITRALWRFATPTLKTVKRLHELQCVNSGTPLSLFMLFKSRLNVNHTSFDKLFVFCLRTAIYRSFENFPLSYTLLLCVALLQRDLFNTKSPLTLFPRQTGNLQKYC